MSYFWKNILSFSFRVKVKEAFANFNVRLIKDVAKMKMKD